MNARSTLWIPIYSAWHLSRILLVHMVLMVDNTSSMSKAKPSPFVSELPLPMPQLLFKTTYLCSRCFLLPELHFLAQIHCGLTAPNLNVSCSDFSLPSYFPGFSFESLFSDLNTPLWNWTFWVLYLQHHSTRITNIFSIKERKLVAFWSTNYSSFFLIDLEKKDDCTFILIGMLKSPHWPRKLLFSEIIFLSAKGKNW